MVGKRLHVIAASLVAVGILSVPATSSAQGYRRTDDRSSVVVQCGSGQRAVMEQRQSYRGSQTVARCVNGGGYGRTRYARRASYDTYRPVSQRSYYYQRAPRRSKTKTALMIAGSTATGAGLGGAIRGKKGALIGAAIGGGTATIYEAAKRR